MKQLADKINRFMTVVMDAFFVFISYCVVVFVAGHNNFWKIIVSRQGIISVSVAAAVFISILYIMNSYKNIWVYASVTDFFNSILGCMVASTVITVIGFGMREYFLSVKIQVVSVMLATCLIIGFRAFIKIMHYLNKYNRQSTRAAGSDKARNLLIVGAGEGASIIIKEILKVPDEYHIIGVVDDDASKIGKMIAGIQILGTRDDIISICRDYRVNEIFIAIPSITNSEKKDILNICNKTNCRIRIMQNSISSLQGPGYKTKLRDVDPEDLLGRDTVILNDIKLRECITDKTVMVTGGGGSIGSELCRQIAGHKPKCLIIFDIYENNAYDLQNELKASFPELNMQVLIGSVRDKNRLDCVFSEFKPQIIFHAAAHKHVPLMEVSPGETIKNNICGTMNVCEAAKKYNAEKFVLISTDKAVNPTNIMGASKRICEMVVQSINRTSKTEFVAVRFGNVLGSNGSVIPLFKRQIAQGGPVTLTHKEITRYFMTIPEAARLVLEAAAFAQGGEIFVLDMGEPVKIYDLAVNLIKLSGYEVGKDIEIKVTGLRPGEKLYEELLMAEEGLKETPNSKIFVARPGEFDYDDIKKKVASLLAISDNSDISIIKEEIHKIVPEYKEPQN